ncbi:hypothetical protein EKH79_02240 [Dyella dinghuensis]|uniref:Uncharacterized protein n=1 Tax=Dyella dinghuensis TaxID=1920169 RepID=A0A3S0S5U5_9GAMM|nr:hypothetical protein [Dyella dinghuensis]RUL66657.1 hypothetical protein EKH79_02240 [Dyella dinghuensis]
MDASQFFASTGGAVEKPRNLFAHPKGALSGVSFLLVTSSLDKQRKVTRPLAGGRNARRAGEQAGDIASTKRCSHWMTSSAVKKRLRPSPE